MFIHNGGGTKLEVMNYGKIQNVLVLHDIQYIVHTTEFVGNFLIKAAPPPPACACIVWFQKKKLSSYNNNTAMVVLTSRRIYHAYDYYRIFSTFGHLVALS